MKWVYRSLAALSLVGAGLVSGGLIPAGWAAVFTATGSAALLFHDAPSNKGSST